MSDSLEQELAYLKKLNERGLLPDPVYHAKVEQALAKAGLSFDLPSAAEPPVVETKGNRNVTAVDSAVAIGRDLRGDVYIGSTPQNAAAALKIYHRVTAYLHGRIPQHGLDIAASDAATQHKPAQLTDIYIALNTTSQRHAMRELEQPLDERTPLSALEATQANRWLVLTGDPGGGKSTFANYLAHSLALRQLQPKAVRDDSWTGTETPIFVTLREFAHALPNPLPVAARPLDLWSFITEQLAKRNLAKATAPLEALLEAGKVMVLFDGLDELPTAALRQFVRDAVRVFAERYPDNRYLVTCRTLAYQAPASKRQPDPRLDTRAFPQFTLALFDGEQIEQFIQAWYQELVTNGTLNDVTASEKTRDLKRAITRADLADLARTPLLLSVMARVHTHDGQLPDARALLYERTIEMLLWRWEELRNREGLRLPTVRQHLHAAGRRESDFIDVLCQLAYEVHRADTQTKESDIGEWRLRKLFATLHDEGSHDWAAALIQLLKLRTGLLVESKPEVFSFPHRTYQEYLAGRHLSERGDFAEHASQLINENRSLWREAVLLAVGHLRELNHISKLHDLVATLCPDETQKNEDAWYRVWFAGEVLHEIGFYQIEKTTTGRDLLRRVRKRLAALLTGAHLPPSERVLAGQTLSQLGDQRVGVCSEKPDLVPIASGTFLMGQDDLYEFTLPAFKIARYPITNAQFRFFVTAGGYTEKWRTCWTDEGWQYKEGGDWQAPHYWDTPQLAHDNQPVVGVSWYEAIAYANWLRETTGENYRLPTEAEWERAARHTDGRVYTWGNEWQADIVNSAEIGIKRPSAVGAFPASSAESGAHDMLGNVWEWCQTRWRNEKGEEYQMPYQFDDDREQLEGDWNVYRVFRGGSSWDDKAASRCGVRLRNSPLYRGYRVGFRVVVSPFSDR